MKDIKYKIDSVKEEILSIEDKKYKNIFESLLSIINDMADSIKEMDYKQESLEESVRYIDEDIIGLQDELFEEVSIEDLIEMEEEYVEIKCKHCNKPLFVEKESLDNKKDIPCPFCNNEAI
ncbi:CD1247 N-terminal domain-containing protein [Clostridium nigeriense]|uniref:CD1247 N-terminal domain-containing protein n=1 Tax=Clostridium nigeriense TaxID=1805470 RepID=UPI003D324EE9